MYRFAVEAFWNVAKHSYADNMHLESRHVGDLLIVRVRDDGRGFDPADPPPGMGLDYLRERAREVGAEFDVISAPDAAPPSNSGSASGRPPLSGQLSAVSFQAVGATRQRQ